MRVMVCLDTWVRVSPLAIQDTSRDGVGPRNANKQLRVSATVRPWQPTSFGDSPSS